MATFSPLIICQSVQIEIPSRRQLNWNPGRCIATEQNAISQLSVSEVQFAAKRPEDFKDRKKEDLGEDGIGKNVWSILSSEEGVWIGTVGVDGVKYALLDDAEEWRPTWFPSVSVI